MMTRRPQVMTAAWHQVGAALRKRLHKLWCLWPVVTGSAAEGPALQQGAQRVQRWGSTWALTPQAVCCAPSARMLPAP